MKTILLLRRMKEDLNPAELSALEAKWPDEELKFVRTDPRDFKEHADDCTRIQPDVVILPVERPIPSLAMQAGFRHVTMSPDGTTLIELQKINVEFGPF